MIEDVLNTESKRRIVRLFITRGEGYIASGREVAREVGLSAPAVHTALKELYEQGILLRDIKRKLHLYSLNAKDRTVQEILRPMFQKESSFFDDAVSFLSKQIAMSQVSAQVCSAVVYGSRQTQSADTASDMDIAVIVRDDADIAAVEQACIGDIAVRFSEYFRVTLDVYIQTKELFTERLREGLPPVNTMMQSYTVIYGEDPLDMV